MKNRRQFISDLAGASFLSSLPFYQSDLGKKFLSSLKEEVRTPASSLSEKEDFWATIRNSYTVSENLINLNNGGVSPHPIVVREALEQYNQMSNEAPSYYMWRVLDKGREPLREKLAKLAGVEKDEIAINRNSSEALETVIFGLRLNPGDEVVLSKQDYPNMINAWKQRAHRDGIILKWVDLDLPNEDVSEITEKYVSQFSSKTKVVHVTHVINWMGQIMPVHQIAEEAHQRGVEVLCDGAHSFAQFEFNIPDLGCDYFGTSLHKWLGAPYGTGMLWVKKEKISQLYPLFAAPSPESEDIRKFENLGTRSFATEQAINEAIDFHEMIGIQRKQERLSFLKSYWANKAAEISGVSIGTSLKPEFSCAIAVFSIDKLTPEKVASELFKKYEVHTVGITWENISGVRVTPNVYTSIADLDVLVEGIKHLAS